MPKVIIKQTEPDPCADGNIQVNSTPFTTVESGGTESVAVVTRESSTPVGTIGAGAPLRWIIPNVRIQAKDTAGGDIGSVLVFEPSAAEPVEPVVIPDTDVRVNTVVVGSVLAGQTPIFRPRDAANNVITPTSVVQAVNTFTATLPVVDPVPATAIEAEVLTGKTFYAGSTALKTGTMPNRGEVDTDITTKAQVVAIQDGYHDGNGTTQIAAAEQAKIIATNIADGVTILGVLGTLSGGGGGIPSALPPPTASIRETAGSNVIVPGTFHIMPYNNPWGNTNRRTGTTGGYYDFATSEYKDKDGVVTTLALAFPDDLYLDWLQWNPADNEVMMYYFSSTGLGTGTWDAAMATAAAASYATYTDWFLPTLHQLLNQSQFLNPTACLNYEPILFNTGVTVWCSTEGVSGTTRRLCLVNNTAAVNAFLNSDTRPNLVLLGRTANTTTDITL